MKFVIKILLIILLINPILKSISEEYVYILNDECITSLYEAAQTALTKHGIDVIKDSQGIIIRFGLENITQECCTISNESYKKLIPISDFLAKIENPAIIGVHLEDKNNKLPNNLKNWEGSTLIANNIESIIIKQDKRLNQNRIYSVGYGEFLPAKNTPNNGVKYLNRVDIMILCNISGE